MVDIEQERAALVALLRIRPSKLTWSDITTEVAARGSARTFWDELHPAGLFDNGDSDALADAARDVASWRSTNLGFLTFRDQVRDRPLINSLYTIVGSLLSQHTAHQSAHHVRAYKAQPPAPSVCRTWSS